MDHVIIGVDPHELSATVEVVDHHEKLLGSGRFTTDRAGFAAMRAYAKAWPDRTWAVEGANGVGRPLAQRLLAAGEDVVDVPAKLAARVRLFDSGHNRKTDAHDAHSIAMVAVRTKGLRVLAVDGALTGLEAASLDGTGRIRIGHWESAQEKSVRLWGRIDAVLSMSATAVVRAPDGSIKGLLSRMKPGHHAPSYVKIDA